MRAKREFIETPLGRWDQTYSLYTLGLAIEL
jgi:hypothetical protein